jgi:hypothetical protein
VFNDNPDIKEKYENFFVLYKEVHFLMKKKQFLTEEEISILGEKCEAIGVVYPKYYMSSIPSKLDDLIIVGMLNF